MYVGDLKLFNFDLELHTGLFYECGSPDIVWTYQCLVKMDACVLCSCKIIERSRSKTFQFFNFDLQLHSRHVRLLK